MKISVNTKHIKAGVIGDDAQCPIAHAVREAVNRTCLKGLLKDRTISVDGGEIKVGSLTMTPPKKVERFVEKFDNSEEVKPFSFTLKFD